MALVTLTEAKQQLNIEASFTGDDEELQRYVDAIGGVIEDYSHETVEQREFVEELCIDGTGVVRLWHTPVESLTSLVSVDGVTTWNPSDLHVSPDTGLVTVLSGPSVIGRVTATYMAGYADPPGKYVQAALLILHHVWETQRGATGTARGLVVGEDEIYDPRSGFTFPRRALEWIGPRPPVVA